MNDASRAALAPWLWLLVALQIAIPASYYLGQRRDDERFAWRMFSAVRVQKCRVGAFEKQRGDSSDRPIELRAVLHSAWIHGLERGRTRVIERFLATRCHNPEISEVELLRRCADAARSDHGTERFHMRCAGRELSISEAR